MLKRSYLNLSNKLTSGEDDLVLREDERSVDYNLDDIKDKLYGFAKECNYELKCLTKRTKTYLKENYKDCKIKSKCLMQRLRNYFKLSDDGEKTNDIR